MAKNKINIKPENKGKFTNWANSKGMSIIEAANRVMSNTKKYSPTIVKRANFAKNASKWNKKRDGGDIVSTMGYRDDSPFRNSESLNIYSPEGYIDMTNVSRPIMANGQYLKPNSGLNQVPPSSSGYVKETPMMSKYGGSIPNIPMYYQDSGTPIYRDTTDAPPNVYRKGEPMVSENPDKPVKVDKKKQELETSLLKYMKKYNITSPYMQQSMMGIIMGEGGIKGVREGMYYTKERLPEVFSRFSKTGKRVKKGQGKYNYNDLATKYEKNPEKLANFVYSSDSIPSNTEPGDGYKFRGAGSNQLTGRGAFRELGKKLGVDLENNPDMLNNNVDLQAHAAVRFVADRLRKTLPRLVKNNPTKYGDLSEFIDFNSIDNFEDAAYILTRTNAGYGKIPSQEVFKNRYNNAKDYKFNIDFEDPEAYTARIEAEKEKLRRDAVLSYRSSEAVDPANLYVQEGPLTDNSVDQDRMDGVMKARLAYAQMHGNPAANRMVAPVDNQYDFSDGRKGTHYMSSIDNYAVPQIQNENGELILGNYGPESNEAIRFDSSEDADYFAKENYKNVSPSFYKYGGYVPNVYRKGDNILTYKNNSDYFDSHARYSDDQKYDDLIRKRVYSGNWGYDPNTQQLHKLNKSQQTKVDPKIKKLALEKRSDIDKKDLVAHTIPKENAWNPYSSDLAGTTQWVTSERDKEMRQEELAHNAAISGQQMNTLFSIPASVTPAGMAIMGMQGATNLATQSGPDFIKNPSWSTAGAAGLDLLTSSPLTIPAGKKLLNFPKSDINWGKWNKKIPANQPLMDEELVDLYRIQERDAKTFSQLAKEGRLHPAFNNPSTLAKKAKEEKYFGQWFTKDKADLDWYARDREFINPEIKHLKIPKTKLNKYSNYDKSLSRAPDREFVIPQNEQSLYKQIEVPKTNFKSEINWSKFNKEIPENKALMQEYNAIEQQAKADGTWMKNPDGSKFTGTSEQFIQQNSENFKKAFPNVITDEAGNIQINYHGSPNTFKEFLNRYKSGDSTGKALGEGIYTTPNKELAESYITARNTNSDNSGKLYELYQNANNKQNKIENLNKYIDGKIEKAKTDLKLGKISDKESNVLYDKILKENDKLWDKIPDKEFKLRNQYDYFKLGNEQVVPFSNYPKSAIGNNGMFDMTNPNIYKSLLPIGGAAGIMGATVNDGVNKKQNGGNIYNVKSGDTFLGIGNRHNITPEALTAANPGIDINKLSIGQNINIPNNAGYGMPQGIFNDYSKIPSNAPRINQTIKAAPVQTSLSSTVTPEFLEHLRLREGKKVNAQDQHYSYYDSEDRLTGGIGHLMTAKERAAYPKGTTIPKKLVSSWLLKDSKKAYNAALKQAKELGIDSQDFINSLASVNYQLGTGWRDKFTKTWGYLKDKNYEKAIPEAADSKWYKQTPVRVKDFQKAIGNLYKYGGSTTIEKNYYKEGGSTDSNNSIPYANISGVNVAKLQEWYSLGKEAPSSVKEASILAEAVGYPPGQAKVVAAQWALESARGSKVGGTYNYFGIKSHSKAVRDQLNKKYGIVTTANTPKKTQEEVNGKRINIKSSFLNFKNPIEAFLGHKAFLETNKRYEKALTKTTPSEFAQGLKDAGYATSSLYVSSLGNVIKNILDPKEYVRFKNSSTSTQLVDSTETSVPLQNTEIVNKQKDNALEFKRKSNVDMLENFNVNNVINQSAIDINIPNDVALDQKNAYIDKLNTSMPGPKNIPRFGQAQLFK